MTAAASAQMAVERERFAQETDLLRKVVSPSRARRSDPVPARCPAVLLASVARVVEATAGTVISCRSPIAGSTDG